MKRVILIVLDSVGIGEQPDSGKYGDEGSNTLGHLYEAYEDFALPNLEALGLGNIVGFSYTGPNPHPKGAVAKITEQSAGKDTTTGHWEMAGLILTQPFPVYPGGFPPEVIEAFEEKTGTKILANRPASGTVIINELGDEHVRTGYPIVYTSADSVFQIAAHEAVVPVEKLYEMCRIARGILKDGHGVGRVIARPFTGTSGNYVRTDRRRDFSIDPPRKTVLEVLADNGLESRAVGKIEDIFNGKGITHAVHTHGNMDGVDRTLAWIKEDFQGLLFTNLVDFDMVYGHRNDMPGYRDALSAFDKRLPEILAAMKEEDVLMITADHGCDPSTPSTDHSREYTPLLIYGHRVKPVNLNIRHTFADIAATIADYFGLQERFDGESFLNEIAING